MYSFYVHHLPKTAILMVLVTDEWLNAANVSEPGGTLIIFFYYFMFFNSTFREVRRQRNVNDDDIIITLDQSQASIWSCTDLSENRVDL